MMSNVFRQDAGPEVDAAWKTLGADCKLVLYSSLKSILAIGLYISFEDRASRVPADKALRSGLAPDQVKIQEKYGGGYPANVEGLHHLHCLVSS